MRRRCRTPASGDPAVKDFSGVLGEGLARLGVVAEHGEQARARPLDRGHPVEGIAAAEHDQGARLQVERAHRLARTASRAPSSTRATAS